LSYNDRQRPRRESWSPPQRGRSTRGRGVWVIDNRQQNRRRNTMPNSRANYQENYQENYQDFNHHVDNDWSNDRKFLSIECFHENDRKKLKI
jgi:hypothetical protein